MTHSESALPVVDSSELLEDYLTETPSPRDSGCQPYTTEDAVQCTL